MTPPRNLRLVRLVAASLLSVGAVLGTGIDHPPGYVAAWMLVGGPFLAAGLLWVPRLEAQLLTRAILWAYLFWATFGSLLVGHGGHEGNRVLLSVGLGTAGALLLLPSDGLERRAVSSRFAPVAFRSVIVLILILAMTDAMVLGTSLAAYAQERWHPSPWTMAFFGGGSVLMAIAVVGLLRMRAWGFGLNLLTNLAVAGLAWVVDDLPWQLALGLTTTAALQVLVAVPLARRIAKPGAADPSPLYRRAGRFAIGAMVLLLVGGRVAAGV